MAILNPVNEPITTADAAWILHCSSENVRKLARSGRLPIAATVGRGQRLFEKAAVEQLASERARSQAPRGDEAA